MTRLRGFAASARQARCRGLAATARQARVRFAILRAFMAAAIVLIGSSSVLACPVCFGAEETAMIDGTKLGIAALLGITLGVQGAFAGFFLYLRRRAKRLAEADLDIEWSQLQRGASRT